MGRKLNNVMQRSLILIQQEGRCAYCNISLFGEPVHYDHLLPWSYLDSSGGDSNWVASCQRCNNKKYSMVFKDMDDVAKFCTRMISSHGSFGEGWEEGSESWQAKLMADATPRNTPNTPSEWVLRQFEKENEE